MSALVVFCVSAFFDERKRERRKEKEKRKDAVSRARCCITL